MNQGKATPDLQLRRPAWYRIFRGASYISAFVGLAWTVAIVLPFSPFSSLPPIIVGGGPGVWFLLAYVLFLLVGIGGFGAFSGFLATVELQEKRTVDQRIMWPALGMLSFGFVGSCTLLAVAGFEGGYASLSGSTSSQTLTGMLSPYVDPVSALVLIAVAGAALALVSMIRARWPVP
jgi:hypothetical protein